MIIDKVLLATDLSLPSQHLADCVSELASLGLKEVVLVHVIDLRASGAGPTPVSPAQEDRLLELTKVQLEERGISVKVREPVGYPAQEILKIAQQEQVSMIAAASHGEGFIKQVFLGSTATDLIRISEMPVLVIKQQDSSLTSGHPLTWNIFRRVLVPLDFSVHTDYLLQVIKEDALLFSQVVLLSVIERARNEMDMLAQLSERQRQMDIVKIDLEQLGCQVKVTFGQGAASQNILEIAEQQDISMIVMATRGGGLIKELTLGSTAHAVARRSHHPLLLIPSRG